MIDSKICSKCGVVKGFGEYCKNKAKKDGLNIICRECAKQKFKVFAEKMKKEKNSESNLSIKKYYQDNKYKLTKTCKVCGSEKVLNEFYYCPIVKSGFGNLCKICRNRDLEKSRKKNFNRFKKNRIIYLKDNKEEISQKYKKYRIKNIDKIKIKNQNWLINNREFVNAKNAKKRSLKLNASVSWADQEKIRWFYKQAIRLTRITGIKFHVDHIAPLKSKYVCGLHNEFNLQILMAYENQSKHNKFTPG